MNSYSISGGPPVEPVHTEQAQEEMLHDADTFADWLSGQMVGAPEYSATVNGPGALKDSTAASLLATGLSSWVTVELRCAAMDELAKRYLNDNDAAVTTRAERIACDSKDERGEE